MKSSPQALRYDCAQVSQLKPGEHVIFNPGYFRDKDHVPHEAIMTIEHVTLRYSRSNNEVFKRELVEENFEYHVALYNQEGFAYFRGRFPREALFKS